MMVTSGRAESRETRVALNEEQEQSLTINELLTMDLPAFKPILRFHVLSF